MVIVNGGRGTRPLNGLVRQPLLILMSIHLGMSFFPLPLQPRDASGCPISIMFDLFNDFFCDGPVPTMLLESLFSAFDGKQP